MSNEIVEYVAVALSEKLVTKEGIVSNVAELVIGEGIGKKITFTLKKKLEDEPNSFLYDGRLYMIDKKDGKQYECIAIEFVRL